MSVNKVDWERAPHSTETYPATTQQLRDRGGSSVDEPEPAAAPLGTDDEAAGTPAAGDRVEMAMKAEQKIIAAAKRRS